MARAIRRDWELGARNPEGSYDWLRKTRRDLKSLRSFVANREMYIYFKDGSIVKSHKLSGDIDRKCLPLEFEGCLEEYDGVASSKKSPST